MEEDCLRSRQRKLVLRRYSYPGTSLAEIIKWAKENVKPLKKMHEYTFLTGLIPVLILYNS